PVKTKMERDFEKYHAENPQVFRLFHMYASEVKARGYKRFSANAIFERIRWHMNIETKGDEYKLNNNYRAFYARKLMVEVPGFEGFFEIREQISKRKVA